jgi:nitroreductase/NAD-dependent dihydropyrimidine dehydrogenase PreA subunit
MVRGLTSEVRRPDTEIETESGFDVNRGTLRRLRRFAVRPIDTRIDPDRCTGCGLCVDDCPTRALSMRDGKAVVTGPDSLGCGHCAAICPTGAVTVGGIQDVLSRIATVEGAGDANGARAAPADLVRLMAARRSCRAYKETPVRREVLEDLVRVATLAPSGTNSQAWTYTILPDRASVEAFGRRVGDFFRKLNRLSEKPLARLISKQLRVYYRDYHDSVEEGLREYEAGGRDRLFHGAPALILIGSRRGDASCPVEDALLASQNVLLAAESMGLGTCLIGFAVEALRHAPPVKASLGIPPDERIHAVVAVGHPARRYARAAGRYPVEIRCWTEAVRSPEGACRDD